MHARRHSDRTTERRKEHLVGGKRLDRGRRRGGGDGGAHVPVAVATDEEAADVVGVVAVAALDAHAGEAHGDDAVGDVGEVEVEAVGDEAVLLRRDHPADAVARRARAPRAFVPLVLGREDEGHHRLRTEDVPGPGWHAQAGQGNPRRWISAARAHRAVAGAGAEHARRREVGRHGHVRRRRREAGELESCGAHSTRSGRKRRPHIGHACGAVLDARRGEPRLRGGAVDARTFLPG